MSTNDSLYRLLSWLSPAYPVGAYAFSHGIENAVEESLITQVDDAADWIESLITHGNGFADLVFLSAAWDRAGDAAALMQVQELALAFQPTAELRLESAGQGAAFLGITADAWWCDTVDTLRAAAEGQYAYPVVVGAVAQGHAIDKQDAMLAYAHAFIANLVSAAVRLVPLGQTDGQTITARLLPAARASVAKAIDTNLDDVATSTMMADITSMNHEDQYTRLFRS